MGIKNSDGNVMNVGYHQNERTATHFTEESLGSGLVSFRIDKNNTHKDLVWLGHWRWDLKMRNPPIPLTLEPVSGGAKSQGQYLTARDLSGEQSIQRVFLSAPYKNVVHYINSYTMKPDQKDVTDFSTWNFESAGGNDFYLKSKKYGYMTKWGGHGRPTYSKTNKSAALKFQVERTGNKNYVKITSGGKVLTDQLNVARLVDRYQDDGSQWIISGM